MAIVFVFVLRGILRAIARVAGRAASRAARRRGSSLRLPGFIVTLEVRTGPARTRVRRAVRVIARRLAEKQQGIASPRMPVDTGRLRDSVMGRATGTRGVTVSTNTPYAVYPVSASLWQSATKFAGHGISETVLIPLRLTFTHTGTGLRRSFNLTRSVRISAEQLLDETVRSRRGTNWFCTYTFSGVLVTRSGVSVGGRSVLATPRLLVAARPALGRGR